MTVKPFWKVKMVSTSAADLVWIDHYLEIKLRIKLDASA